MSSPQSLPSKALTQVRAEERLLHLLADEFSHLDAIDEGQLARGVKLLGIEITRIETAITLGGAERRRIIASWRGDLEHERQARGGSLSEHFLGDFERLIAIEKRVESLRTAVDEIVQPSRSIISALSSQKPVPHDAAQTLHSEAERLIALEQQWLGLDKDAEKVIAVLDSATKANDVHSDVLQNYKKGSAVSPADIINGRGHFAQYSLEQRQKILARVTKYRWLLPIDAMREATPHERPQRIVYGDALLAIQSGAASFCYPQEYFETILYALESKDEDYVRFVDEIWTDWDWTNVAIERCADKNLILLWHLRGSSQVIRIPVDFSADFTLNQQPGLSDTTPLQCKMLWGAAWSTASKTTTMFLTGYGWPPSTRILSPLARGFPFRDVGHGWILGAGEWTGHNPTLAEQFKRTLDSAAALREEAKLYESATPRQVNLPARDFATGEFLSRVA